MFLGTSSLGKAALPRVMLKLENSGAKNYVGRTRHSTGYSVQLDGTSIYLTMAANLHRAGNPNAAGSTNQLYVAGRMCGSPPKERGVSMTGAGVIVLAATLCLRWNVPVAGCCLFWSRQLMSGRAFLDQFNGILLANMVVARWTKAFGQEG